MQSYLFPYRAIPLQKLLAGHGLSRELDLVKMAVIWHRFWFLAAVCFNDFVKAAHSIRGATDGKAWRVFFLVNGGHKMPSQWVQRHSVDHSVMNANTKCILILPLFYSPSLNVFKWNILTRCTYLLGKFRLHWPSHQYGKSSLGLQARPLMPPLLPQICKHWDGTEPDDSWLNKVRVRCWGTSAAWWETSHWNKVLMYSSSEAE